MDFETPVDAWYVWCGVALAGVTLAGLALSLPAQPPPDATEAANTIDRVAGSTYTAQASYEHDAEMVRIDGARISMRNGGGVDHAAVAFTSLTPVAAVSDATKREALERILHGEQPSAVLERPAFTSLDEPGLYSATAAARTERLDEVPEWRPAGGELRVRKLEIDGETVVLVDA